jgi:hypothetical protein
MKRDLAELEYVQKLVQSFKDELAARQSCTGRPPTSLPDVSLKGDALALARISVGMPAPRTRTNDQDKIMPLPV